MLLNCSCRAVGRRGDACKPIYRHLASHNLATTAPATRAASPDTPVSCDTRPSGIPSRSESRGLWFSSSFRLGTFQLCLSVQAVDPSRRGFQKFPSTVASLLGVRPAVSPKFRQVVH